MVFRILLLLFTTCFSLSKASEKYKYSTSNNLISVEQVLILPALSDNYVDIEIPSHLSTNFLLGPGQNAAIDNDNSPVDNVITNEGATLGRVLFYDKFLSTNQTISCASCHRQALGFSDNNNLSKGFDGRTTRRHSMSLVNARWYARGRFFWDERASTLEEQVLLPFQDPVEMGMTLNEVVQAVKNQSFYPALFNKAFGSEEITSEKISKALSQFIRSIVSVNSKYDIGRQEVATPVMPFSNFTESENNGKQLFFRPKSLGGLSCVGCHSTEAFINPDAGATNNGLDLVSVDDLGVFEAIPNPVFLGTFKVPSLKNIALSAPYMHDGRFATLEEVVEHYNSGVQNHPNLNSSLKDNGQPQQLNLTAQEKIDLVNFLKTLTDESLMNDEKFSDPFVQNDCQEAITIRDVVLGSGIIQAADSIISTSTISSTSNVIFGATSVLLDSTFSVDSGAIFSIQINDCSQL